jgi:hypothetical protein
MHLVDPIAVAPKERMCPQEALAKLVTSIDLSTGEWVPRVDSPHLTAYLLLLLYPVIGFLLPWGCIRILTWVGNGFVVPRG